MSRATGGVVCITTREVVPTVHARTLARAAQLVGGAAALADRLRVSPEGLHLWLSGKVEPPQRVFLEAIDIVLANQLDPLSKDDKGRPIRKGQDE